MQRAAAGTAPSARIALVVLGIWIAALVLVMQRHEMWRDELQAWSIAAPATSLPDLWHRASYEPDPNLWFVILFAASRISAAPFVLQVVNALIAAAAAALVLLRAPFPVPLRILLSFSYMMFFEWGVISRPYALVVLLTLGCAEALLRRASPVIVAVLLFLLMTASMYGFLLAGALGLFGVWQTVREREASLLQRLAAMAIVAAGLLCVAAKLVRPPDFVFPQDAHSALRTLASVTEGFAPLVPLRPGFWNVNILPLPLSAAIGLLLLCLAVATFRHNPPRVLFIAGACALLAMTYFVSNGAWRQHGLLLIAFVAAQWVMPGNNRRTLYFLGVLLTVQCFSTATAVVNEWRTEFSAASRVARYIESKGWQNGLLIGYPDHTTSPVAGYLGRDLYFVNGGRFGRYATWDGRRFQADPRALMGTIENAQRAGRTVLAIAGSGRQFRIPNFQLLASFGPATVPDETYRLYLVRPNGQSVGP